MNADGEPVDACFPTSSELEIKINQIVEERLERILLSKHGAESKSLNSSMEKEDGPEENPLVWNINAMSLLCWKGWDWPHNQTWNKESLQFEKIAVQSGITESRGFQYLTETYLLRYFLCYFPVVLAFLELVTLVGMTDQGSTLKRMIYGDGYYQSALWRYSRNADSRDSFQPAFSTNGTKIGFTANILKNRPSNEVERCLDETYVMPINEYQWTGNFEQVESVLMPLIDQIKPNSSWLFSHCLPWEYARLCGNVLKANKLMGQKLTESELWTPNQCVMHDPNGHHLMAIEDWEGLSVSPDEIRKSHAEALVPKRLEDRLELVMWVVTRLVCDAKSLNFNDDSFSSFLYINVSYLYRLGVGEAYMVELMTITTLSFFLFYTSFLGEAQQLMHQVTLCSTLRCYEDAVFSMGTVNGMAPSSHALLRKAGKSLAHGISAAVFHCMALITGDFMCDLFLSLRILFLAYMVMCTEMITTWDHGVLAVIFSVLAIAFLFEIDDKLMEMFQTMGWTESAFYTAKLRPMLHDFALEEKRDQAAFRFSESTLRSHIVSWWSRGLKQPTLWGMSILRFWAFLLITALFAVHQHLVFQLATGSGTQSDIIQLYDSIFYEWGSAEAGGGYQIAKLSSGIFVALSLNTVCYRGISSIGNLIQLGLCLIWVYAVFRETVINGILVWYADLRPDQSVEEHFLGYLFHDSALLFFPSFSLHVLCCTLRPLLFYLRFRYLRSSTAGPLSSSLFQISCQFVAENGTSQSFPV